MMLLTAIRRFLHSSGMRPTAFGRAAVNDPRLVGDLVRGRQPGQRLTARVEAYIAAQDAPAR